MAEDAFVSACLRMEEAYTAIIQALPPPGGCGVHADMTQWMKVIRVCRHQLISGVGARRASLFEQLIKAQVLEMERETDESSCQEAGMAHESAIAEVYGYISLYQPDNTKEFL